MGCGSSNHVSQPLNPPVDSPSNVNDVGSSPSPLALQDETIHVELSAETLEKYLEMENEIQTYEKKHVMENYQVKTEQLEKLEKKVQELEESQKELEQQAAALHTALGQDDGNDQISVKQFLMEKAESGQELNKEEEDFVDALNRQEIIRRELESTTKQRDTLKEEVANLAEEGDKIQKLYEERDELLDNIFGGEYGSDLENSLEEEVDLLQEQKKHVDQAHFKWKQAHMMVKQATSQLGLSVQKWKEMSDISPDEFEQRYSCAAETRNNLVAAIQNLQGAQRYLPNVVFPYCSEEEVDTLEKAVSNIFTDIQSDERHEHALACYDTTYRRSSALRQWFEQVLNTTIAQDLDRITETCKTKTLELRRERIRLIRKKVKEMTGKDVDVDPVMVADADVIEDDAAADEQVAQLFEADNPEEQDNFLSPGPLMPPAPTPVPISELAAPPTNEEIFGKIDELRKRHEEEVEYFKKSQAMNHARMEMGLKEKLHARRNRRDKIQAHVQEVQALETAA